MSKKIALVAAITIFALAAGKTFSILAVGSLFNFSALIWLWFLLSIAITYAIFFVLTLSKDWIFITLASVLIPLGILVFLPHQINIYIFGVVLILANLTLYNFAEVVTKSLNVKYFSSVYHKSIWVGIMLIALFSIFYAADINSNSQFVQKSINFLWPYIRVTVPQFNSEQTVDQYLKAQFVQQGVSNPTPVMLAEGEREMGQQLSAKLTGNETMSDVGRNLIIGKVQQLFAQSGVAGNSFYLVFLFLVILLPFVRLLLAVVATLVYLLALATKLVFVTKTEITVNTLEI